MRSVFRERPDAAEVRRRAAGFRGWWWMWLPAVLACLVIVLESTQAMGGNHTSRILRPLFTLLFGAFSDERWETVHHYVRKTGHFVGYGTVCLTFVRGWLITFAPQLELPSRVWRWGATWLGLLSAFIVASCDELHQSFLPNRTGKFADVVLDTCGGVVMCSLVWLIFRWEKDA